MRTYRGGHHSNLAAPDVNVATTADASVVVIRPGVRGAPAAARGAAGPGQHPPRAPCRSRCGARAKTPNARSRL